jgi:trimeric autotransporter adhesin
MVNLLKMFFKLAIWIGAFVITGLATANPSGGDVTAGNASIAQAGTTTTINQTSPETIIKWQSFNIKANETTHFQQPANGVALNRINPQQGVSQIYGTLSATGRIILINGAGIHFGPGSVVNVGSIIASTADISDANFLNKKFIFDKPSTQSGAIINEGSIKSADYGLVALLGTGIVNSGNIEAKMGSIALAAGNKFTLDFTGDQLINFTVDEEAKTAGVDEHRKALSAGVKNTGEVLADGGQVLVTARVATHVLDKVIDMEGVAEAHSTSIKNGIIILSSGSGKIEVSGTLDASGNKTKVVTDNLHHPYAPHRKLIPPMTGGTIEVLGDNINLTATAILDVSGTNGGGNIYVGGNQHGAGPLPNASSTTVATGALLNASALEKGNGGNVIVWSDKKTDFSGSIIAKGGSKSGNGGFSEVSSLDNLNFKNANIDLSANHGATGQLLLDPSNITLASKPAVTSVVVQRIANKPISSTDIDNARITANVTITTATTTKPIIVALANESNLKLANTVAVITAHSVKLDTNMKTNGAYFPAKISAKKATPAAQASVVLVADNQDTKVNNTSNLISGFDNIQALTGNNSDAVLNAATDKSSLITQAEVNSNDESDDAIDPSVAVPVAVNNYVANIIYSAVSDNKPTTTGQNPTSVAMQKKTTTITSLDSNMFDIEATADLIDIHDMKSHPVHNLRVL